MCLFLDVSDIPLQVLIVGVKNKSTSNRNQNPSFLSVCTISPVKTMNKLTITVQLQNKTAR